MLLRQLIPVLALFIFFLLVILVLLRANEDLVSINLLLWEIPPTNVGVTLIWTFVSGGFLGLLIGYLPVFSQAIKIKRLTKKLTYSETELERLRSSSEA